MIRIIQSNEKLEAKGMSQKLVTFGTPTLI